jgi:hypothetical protein
VLIALTETGIWTKSGEVTGAWVQTVAKAAPVSPSHYAWTSVVIADSVYVYRQNDAHFYRIDSNVLGGVSVTELTPNFLNMAAQAGIFRAAGRLAFWDSDDSIAWSNLSDFTDFTPSLETLAGNIKFSSIQGRIVTILSHGEGFLLYSTKSIVYIKENLASLSQWDPTVVLDSAGIAYPRQAAVASPDTLHFAFTSEGIKKIENGQQESIVVEVSDFIKDTLTPTYLKVIEGRYLFLESMDKNFLVGNINISDEVVESVDYVIPGSTTNLADIEIPGTEGSECAVLEGIDNGQFPDTIPGGNGIPAPDDAHPTSPGYKAEWTCYISEVGVADASAIEWIATPCPTTGPDGVEMLMCPNIPQVSALTQDATGKREVAGSDAYIDGWTMERFVAVQSSIWERHSQAVQEVVSKISSRSKTKSITTSDLTSCVASSPGESLCYLGRFAASYSAPKFGYSTCEFWLTRYVTGMVDLNRKMKTTKVCDAGDTADTQYRKVADGGLVLIGTDRNSIIDQDIAIALARASATNLNNRNGYTLSSVNYGSGTDYNYTYTTTNIDAPYAVMTWTNYSTLEIISPQIKYSATDTTFAYNEATMITAAPIPETAYCKITGWKYKKADGSEGFLAAAGECMSPALYPSNATSRNTPLSTPSTPAGPPEGTITALDPFTGAMCGVDYDPITLEGSSTIWPDAVITIPDSKFFLQAGSNAPLYPTMQGAYVYDLQLKKWGKMLYPYMHLFNYSPINSSVSGKIPSTSFGILGAILDIYGAIRIFDEVPAISWIAYGKVGYYRLGKTSPEEVRVDFKSPSSGVIKIHSSLDGVELTPGLSVSKTFSSSYSATVAGGFPGSWCDIEIRGNFDISYLEYRGFTQGRR